MTTDERAQIRAEAVRECICKPPAMHDDCGTVVINPSCQVHGGPIPPLEPWHAGVKLNDQNEWAQPPPAAAHGEAGTLHEPTVRACIEIVERLSRDAVQPPDQYAEAFDAGIKSVCTDIQTELAALLPKPDPVKELVEAYENDCSLQFLHPMDIVKIERLHFARWLIDTGRLKP